MGLFDKLFEDCNRKVNGDILLGFGLHEVTIDVGRRPCKVFFSIKDPADGHSVCHGSVNKVGLTINDVGFIIYADINTNSCFIEWTCDF
jgi:hypothetical protein